MAFLNKTTSRNLSKHKGGYNVDNELYNELATTPSTPPSGYRKVYSKTDGHVYHLSSAGVETDISAQVAQTTQYGQVLFTTVFS